MKVFMSVLTSAVLESRAISVTVHGNCDAPSDSGAEIQHIIGFPDGICVYSNGFVDFVSMPVLEAV